MREVILIGNPNTGKTTLFNTLTSSNEKASNWHGVTVGEKTKKYKFEDEEFLVTDLPGMYSLIGYSNEEKIANEYLERRKENLIINICDANNLRRNLKLSLELIEKGYKVILAVNMANEVKDINFNALSKFLGVPVVPIDARKRKSVQNLKLEIKNYKNKKPQKTPILVKKHDENIQINEILNYITTKNGADNYKLTKKIDKILLNKFIFFPVFLLVIFCVFYLTFGPVGDLFLSVFELIFGKISTFLQNLIFCLNMSDIIKAFLVDGVLSSIFAVLEFVPQIVLLMFFINFLEDIGFMSRVAFMFDGILKKIGLTGKSFFSLMMGFGCTTSAIMTTRNLENKNLRKRTALLLPFMTCTAKLPVFLVLSSLFFDKYKYVFVFLLYLFAIFVSIIVSLIYKKLIPSKVDVFILEMPKYRLPSLKKIILDLLQVIKEFLIKVGSTILFFSIIVWFLQNFSTGFNYIGSSDFSNSILYFISSKFVWLFKFIGIDNAGLVSALFFGIVAKEMVLVGLSLMNGVSGSIEILKASLVLDSSVCYFSWQSSIVFLVFILIYSPCISALAMVKSEFGTKTALFVFGFQFALAFLISFIIFKCLTNINFIFVIAGIVLLEIIVSFVIKLKKKKNNCKWGNCGACRKI